MRDLNTFFKKHTSEVEIYIEEKQDLERFLIFLNIKMSTKSRKNELNEEFMVMWKEESQRRSYVKQVFLEISQNSQENTCARVPFLIILQVSRNF